MISLSSHCMNNDTRLKNLCSMCLSQVGSRNPYAHGVLMRPGDASQFAHKRRSGESPRHSGSHTPVPTQILMYQHLQVRQGRSKFRDYVKIQNIFLHQPVILSRVYLSILNWSNTTIYFFIRFNFIQIIECNDILK